MASSVDSHIGSLGETNPISGISSSEESSTSVP